MNLRIILATLLAISFFLPLSRCDRSHSQELAAGVAKDMQTSDSAQSADSKQGSKAAPQTEKPKREPDIRDTYAFENIRSNSPVTWFIPLAYFWPVLVVVVRRRVKDKALARMKYVELAGCLGSGYMLFYMTLLEDNLLIGGWLAVLGISAWGALVCFEIGAALFRRLSRTHTG